MFLQTTESRSLPHIKGCKVFLSKHKENGGIEFAPGYFNSTAKTMINSKYDLDKCFQEILYRIDNRSNEGSGWIIESADAEYVNISILVYCQEVHTLNCLVN